MSNARLHSVTNSVFSQIKNSFEEGDDGEFLFTSPLDGSTSYDLYPSNHDNKWDVIVDDQSRSPDNTYGIASLDAAKHRVAELIAKKIVKSEALIATAEAKNLLPA